MFKRVEVITDDLHKKCLTLGELFKLNGENGPLARIATKLQVWSTQLPWVHLGKNGKIGFPIWRRDMFGEEGDNAEDDEDDILGENVQHFQQVMWPKLFHLDAQISKEVKETMMTAVTLLRQATIKHALNSIAFTLFLEFSQIVPSICAREWWTLDMFKLEILDACGLLDDDHNYKLISSFSNWTIDKIKEEILERAENIREIFEDAQVVALDALTKDGHVRHTFKHRRIHKVRCNLDSNGFDLTTPKFECYFIFFNTLISTGVKKQSDWMERRMANWRNLVNSEGFPPEGKEMIDARKKVFRNFLEGKVEPPNEAICEIEYSSD